MCVWQWHSNVVMSLEGPATWPYSPVCCWMSRNEWSVLLGLPLNWIFSCICHIQFQCLSILTSRLGCGRVFSYNLDRVKRIWYLSPMRAAKVQASLRIRAVSPEPSLLAHTSSESRGTFRQKTRSLAPLNGWACAVEICHDGMLEDTNSLDGAHFILHPKPAFQI